MYEQQYYTVLMLVLAFLLIQSIFLACIFKKANEKWWKAFVPFYSDYIMFKFIYGNGYLFLIPLMLQGFTQANTVFAWIMSILAVACEAVTSYKLAKAFGKSKMFAVGLLFIPTLFTGILAFDKSEYQGVLRDGLSYEEIKARFTGKNSREDGKDK